MGATTNGFWFPDRSTPIGSLHTILAQMQNTAQTARDALRAELIAPLPEIGVVSTGSPQTFTANSQIVLNGGSNGWATTVNNAAAAAAGMAVLTGVRDTPITLSKAGAYSFTVNVVHTPTSGDFAQQCYTDLGFTGSLERIYRIIWSFGAIASATIRVNIPNGSTLVSLRSFTPAIGRVDKAELNVWKDR